MGATQIWTLGHSTHELPVLVGLLRRHGIDAVADVRSQPFSRYNPQFNQGRLRSGLLAARIGYVFCGNELGGRPPEPEFYDAKGHVRYPALARSPRFGAGLERLLAEAATRRVAILCSEEDPGRCHRRLLVGRALAGRGITVVHIRADGTAVSDGELGRLPQDPAQGTLFGADGAG